MQVVLRPRKTPYRFHGLKPVRLKSSFTWQKVGKVFYLLRNGKAVYAMADDSKDTAPSMKLKKALK